MLNLSNSYNNSKNFNLSYNNPFNQSKHTWLTEIPINFAYIEAFALIFEDITLSISYFELEGNGSFDSKPDDLWMLQLYFDSAPKEELIYNRLNVIATTLNIAVPKFNTSLVQDIDWIKHTQENFPPFAVGNFFVHNSSFHEHKPIHLYPLEIDAGRAFGTGEHETTSCCLLAISKLAKKYQFYNMLDMGCGSGILAIAQAKTWQQSVHAVDIDLQSVITTKRNIQINKVHKLVTPQQSNGYQSKYINNNAPYDLIISNILAKPLVKFAPYLARNLARGGIAILSGLLSKQEKMVLNAHRLQGLSLIYRIQRNAWTTLILGS
ncbi:Ribosomal protein L11 methyltransferase [Rickettsiales bacterium Ac37b]|nr:Ribosomal protein L11 methyltransferase [Rickettsiales bacterium Ac37b]